MPRARRSEGPASAILVVVTVVLLLSGAGWWWLRSRDEPAPAPAPPSAFEEGPPTLDRGQETIDLPALGASDALIRDLVAGLSEHPQLASWLVTDELVHRFVGAVVELAGGLSPSSRMEFMIPEEEFRVVESGETVLIDPAGYRRYDVLAETVTSLDTQGSARLYWQLYPLFEEAYDELGIPDGSFGEAMSLAVDNLVSAEIPAGRLELQPNEAIYEFQDLEIESRSPAEKHLIRMGPENAQRIQAELAELWAAIESEGPPAGR